MNEPNYALTAANWLVLFPPGFGLLLALVSAVLYGSVPATAFAWSAVGLGLAMLTIRRRAVRGARVATTAGVVGFGYVAACFVGLSASAAYNTISPTAGFVMLVAGSGLVMIAVANIVPRRLQDWEAERDHNLGRALDLDTAEYSFGADRGFRYKDRKQARGGRLWAFAGGAFALAAGLPILFPHRGHGHTDARTYLVLFLGVPVAIAFAPLLATGWVNMRKLTEFEAEIGRPIYNR